MAASADSRFCAFGFLVPDVRELDDKTRQKLHLPPALLTVSNAATSEKLWQVRALEVRRVPKPPEPADAFPDMAEDFNMKALTLAPFRVAVSTALNGDGSRVALTEYGGWLRIKRERGIGGWDPYFPVPVFPPQRGRVRVFGQGGEEPSQGDQPS